ncbi:ImuA family protein [Marinovum sp.]|uniref:ImuA family protein n=1 Tax=Marinovum sp. TaxID=2024839 RepID=UPI003A8D1313
MSRHHTLLTRAPQAARPALSVTGELSLTQMRVHEFCGLARRTLAAWVAGAVQAAGPGPVIWVAPAWEKDALFAPGLARLCAPERFVFVHPTRPEDILWTLEEVLRSGAAPLVVGDLPGLPGLTQVRRLHLAAETGAEVLGGRPLGLLLTPGREGGAPGVESRWRLDPAHAPEVPGWRLTRLRARTAPRRDWQVRLGQAGPELAPLPA